MNISKLKSKIRKLILGYDVPTYYFSQCGEDAILEALFSKKLRNRQKGFFVDVGAYHPYKHSNTYLFYINGWSGINIDPCPGSMKLFNKIRNRDINLEIGVSDEAGSLTYYLIDKGSTMNTFSKENLLNLSMYKYVKEEIPVGVRTLKDIFEEYSNQFEHIDLLTIDAEGFDLKILQSNDWNKYQPDVIAIELNVTTLQDVITNESTLYLENLGYKVVAKNVVISNVATVFFVRNGFEY